MSNNALHAFGRVSSATRGTSEPSKQLSDYSAAESDVKMLPRGWNWV